LKILVTGGAGFIGSAVVDQLVESGDEVRVLDNLSASAHACEPAYLNPDAQYVWGDLADRDVVDRAVEGVEAVCHQAARVGLGVDFGDVADFVRDNDLGTATLLEALHRHRWQGRLVLASSMVVYGEGAYACKEHGALRPGPRLVEDLEAGRFEATCQYCRAALEPLDLYEDAPLEPRNVYAATKLHQEHLCGCFARETGSELVSLRYHNVYGPRMPRDTPYAGVASIFRSFLESGRSPRVFEDGNQRRDFVHVDDVARANLGALHGDGTVTGAFNIASGEASSVGSLAHALCAVFGETSFRPLITGEYRLGDVRHITASPERARQLMGFEAKVSFEQGMRQFARVPLR